MLRQIVNLPLRPLLLGCCAFLLLGGALLYLNQTYWQLTPFAQKSTPGQMDPASLQSEIFPELSQLQPAASTAPAMPTEALPVPEQPAKIQIEGKQVNLRAQPSRQAKIVVQVNQGQIFELTGAQQQAEGLSWLELKLPAGGTAWVSQQFARQPAVEITKATAEPTLNLHQQGPAEWLVASDRARILTAQLLLSEIFRDSPEQDTPENLVRLNACLEASSRDKSLQKLKIYQLAAACALALGWR